MNRAEFENIAKDLRKRAAEAARACGAVGDEAEDVAQDVMLRLWTLHDNIAGAEHAARLSAVAARHIAVDMRRRQHTVPLNTGRPVIDESRAQPDISLETDEQMALLTEQMSRLPSKEYQILRLRQLEMKSNGDIADILGMDKASVATMLSRARKKLFNELQ